MKYLTALGAATQILFAGRSAAQAGPAIAITNVSVIDVAAGRAVPGQSVVIEDRRISALGPANSTLPPRGARIIDGRGKYLIPGLWDMHVHTTIPDGERILGIYVVNGVTGVRDMNDSFPRVVEWRGKIAAGQLLGPRIVAAGPYITNRRVPIPHFVAMTAEEGRAAVDSLVQLKVDFIKIHGNPRVAFFAIADQARKRGIVFAGHVPDSVTVVEASDAGQRSLEHLFGFPNQCTTEETATLKPTPFQAMFLGKCSTEDLSPWFARLKQNDTWITPTVIIQYPLAILPDTVMPSDSTKRYLSPELAKLQKLMMGLPRNVPPEAAAVGKVLFRKRLELIGALFRAGVPLLVGSDAPGFNAFPGFSIHEELERFVEGGVTPAGALKSATYEPARYLGALDSLGTVAKGKLADVVLLEGNPLENITSTKRIVAVIANGRLVDAEDRRRILMDAERAARR